MAARPFALARSLPSRLVLDVTTSYRGARVPHGILRVQAGVIGALVHRMPRARLAIFDDQTRRYLALAPGESTMIADAGRPGSGTDDGVRAPRPHFAARDIVGPQAFKPGDILLDIGSGWDYDSPEIAENLKRCAGIRYVAMCHDIIPVMFPEWCGEHWSGVMDRHFRRQFSAADLVLFHSRRVAADVAAYAEVHRLGPIRSRFIRIGVDPLVPASGAPLPAGLTPGRYVLAVGTIEPRKGHRLLLEAWRRLRQAGVLARHGFALVLAGQEGWMVDSLLAEFRKERELHADFLWLSEAGDATLDVLYRNAAFCAVPSIYEGYGLPAVEAFVYGKPLVCSNGGALPEVTQGLCNYLDPVDLDAWTAALASWISDPAARDAAAAKVERSFAPTRWPAAAQGWVDALAGI
ncbi:MAG: glycosyltransferase family 4 protein [Rhodospirillaceae bacterium]|nr:glycosyltransferase family 4 protein [Rhodospirillaceae bacterium]